MEPLQIGAAFAIALAAVKLAEVAISALREAIARKNGNGKKSYNGSSQEVIDWLKELNLSVKKLESPLTRLNEAIRHFETGQATVISKLDNVKTDTALIKDRGLVKCPLKGEGR